MRDKQRRNAWILKNIFRLRYEWFLSNGPCKCGSWNRLEVDHIDPSTKVAHRIWSWSKARRKAELSKCQVICRRCHIRKTAKENSRPIQHGTHTGYSYYDCRCRKCTKANSAYVAEWRKKAGRH